MPVKFRKSILLAAIILSFLPIPFVLDYKMLSNHLEAQAFIARVSGTISTVVIFWAAVLGMRMIFGRLVQDWLWVNKIHRWFGKSSIVLIIAHPILISLYYYSAFAENLWYSQFDDPLEFYVHVGQLALIILLIVGITSAFFRRELPYRVWHLLHLLNYTIFPLVVLHTGAGSNIYSPLSQAYWLFLFFLFTLTILYRVACFFGYKRYRYIISDQRQVSARAKLITLKPLRDRIVVSSGQFVYIQHPLVTEAHPYSVARYNSQTGEISILVLISGAFSKLLGQLDPGVDSVLLDGPYGVFLDTAYTTPRPLLVIAGGVGIAPFVSLLSWASSGGWNKEVILIYANRTESDISLKPELDALAHSSSLLRVVYVVEDSENASYFKGRVTADVIKNSITKPVPAYECFVCGPNPMVESIQTILLELRVPKEQIRYESFSL